MGEQREMAELLQGKRVVVLAGAGCSTESGIPDYRGEGTARRARSPMQFQEFKTSPKARARYWSRSLIGWPKVASASPNPGHIALATLEKNGAIIGTITQNVDGLHQRAGSQSVVELHGRLSEVVCMGCQSAAPRQWVQDKMLEGNPDFQQGAFQVAPDGDADIDDIEGFQYPSCQGCKGALKPNVVFFGECVPRSVVETARNMVNDADALLVVGTSLAVYSGFRFVRQAAERKIPIATINLLPSRGDEFSSVIWREKTGVALPRLTNSLVG